MSEIVNTSRLNAAGFKPLVVLMILLCVSAVQAQHSAGGLTPTAMAGGAPAGSYALSDFDNVNLFNGNLNFRLPLLSVGGRGAAQHRISLSIERKWDTEKTSTENPDVFYWRPVEYQRPGLAPGYSPGVMQGHHIGNENQTHVCSPNALRHYLSTKTTLMFTAPDGTEYELLDQQNQGAYVSVPLCPSGPPSRGKVFVSKEGEAAVFVSDTDIYDEIYVGRFDPLFPFRPTGNLTLRDGTRYRIVNGLVTSLRDRNGNTLTFAYEYQLAEGPDGRVKTITDSLNRVVNISYATANDLHDRISYQGFGGALQTITISYANLSGALRTTQPTDSAAPKSYAQLFPYLASDTTPFDPRVISSISLPDNRSYVLKYNVYGELARVALPTGGAFEYDYGTGLINAREGGSFERYSDIEGTYKKIYRRVTERRVYPDGNTLESKITFSQPETYNTNSFNVTDSGYVTVVQSDASNLPLSYQKHYFFASASPSIHELQTYNEPDWTEGREWKTEIYNSLGATLLRRVQHEWAPAPGFGQGARINWTETTLADTNQVARQEFAYDPYHNQTDVYEYDYGSNGVAGPFLRRSHTTFVNSPAYTDNAVHLVSLPSEQWISSDINGTTKASFTTYEYDNYAEDARHAPLRLRAGISGLNPAFTDTYTVRGNLTSATSYANASSQTGAITTALQYDVAGNVIKAIDGRGNALETDYSAAYQYAYPTSATSPIPDPTGQSGSNSAFVTTTSYDLWTGCVTSIVDINNQVTAYEYNDVLNRLTRVIRPDGGQTVYQYGDAIGNLYLRTQTQLDASRWLDAAQYFDGLGRSVSAVQSEGATAITSRQEYDALGRIKRSYNLYRTTADETYGWTETGYDALSRVVRVETFKSNAASTGAVVTQYNGNTVTVIDQAGKQRRSVTDALGRLTSVIEDPNSLNYQTGYLYDVLGNLRQVQQGQQTRTFTYNSLSRLTSSQNPESGTLSYQYDANGNLAQRIDARGVTAIYAYDALNRVTSRSYTNDPQQTPAVSYKYDTPGIMNAKGRLTSISSSVSTTSYAGFDALGRVLSSSQATNGQTYSLGYEYDLAGNLKSELYPSGRMVQHGFDAAGRLQSVTGIKGTSSTTYAAGLSYTAHGAVRQQTLGNGLIEQNGFNSRLQLEEIKLGTVSNPTDKLRLQYEYGTANNNGNVLSQTITVPGMAQPLVQTYEYDDLSRLSQARETNNGVQSWKQMYAYDRFGNRSLVGGSNGTTMPAVMNAQTNPAVNTATNRFADNQGYSYDAAGNMTAGNGLGYDFDAENRIVTAYDGNPNPNRYSYDGDGRRVKKVTANGQETTIFVYDALGQMVAEYSNLPAATENQTSYLTSDKLGTPRVITKADVSVKSRHDFLPFGEDIGANVGGRTTAQGYSQFDGVRQRYTGAEHDDETGMDFMQARYYSSVQGRFTSVDPLMASARAHSPQTWNRYTYAWNNPVKYNDPSGLIPPQGEGDHEIQSQEQTASELPDPPPPIDFTQIVIGSEVSVVGGSGDRLTQSSYTFTGNLTIEAAQEAQAVYEKSYYAYYPNENRNAAEAIVGNSEITSQSNQTQTGERNQTSGTAQGEISATGPKGSVSVTSTQEASSNRSSTQNQSNNPHLSQDLHTVQNVNTIGANAVNRIAAMTVTLTCRGVSRTERIGVERARAIVNYAIKSGRDAANEAVTLVRPPRP